SRRHPPPGVRGICGYAHADYRHAFHRSHGREVSARRGRVSVESLIPICGHDVVILGTSGRSVGAEHAPPLPEKGLLLTKSNTTTFRGQIRISRRLSRAEGWHRRCESSSTRGLS